MTQEDIKYYQECGLKGNELKSKIQKEKVINYLIKTKLWLYFKLATGFGKGFIIETICHRLRKKSQEAIVIVVPSTKLKEDIDKFVEKNDYYNIHVYVINTFTMNFSEDVIRKAKILIVDELHHACGENSVYFSNCLNLIEAEYKIGLTATLKEEHEKFLKSKGWKLGYEIETEDLLELDLVPNYEEYNLAVGLEGEEREKYIEYHKVFDNTMRYFSSITRDGYHLMMACAIPGKKKVPVEFEGQKVWKLPDDWVQYVAKHYSTTIWQVKRQANVCREAMQAREKILNKSSSKLKATIQFCEENKDKKIIIFTSDIEMCELYAKKLNAIAYHSKLPAKQRLGTFKTVTDKVALTKTKVKISPSVLDNYEALQYGVLVTVKALDEGYNVEGIDTAWNAAFTSNSSQRKQRRGRTLRLDKKRPDKTAYTINLYTNLVGEEIEAQDKQKLMRSQRNAIGIRWAKNLTDLTWQMKNKTELMSL